MAGCADDVAAWLEKLGLAEYTENFLAAGYSSLQQCVFLSKAELLTIGIAKVGHVNRLFKDLERMKGNSEVDTPSPPRSSSTSPQPPPVANAVAPPSVPPRRPLHHKPKSDGSILDCPPPPKLLPRKGSLNKSASAHVIKPINTASTMCHKDQRNMDQHNMGEKINSKFPTSQSLDNIFGHHSPELKSTMSSGALRVPPPIMPRSKSGVRKPAVPQLSRNGQVTSLPALHTGSDKGISTPPVPTRRTTTPLVEEKEESAGIESVDKEETFTPFPVQQTGCSQMNDVLRSDQPLANEDDNKSPPLPVRDSEPLVDELPPLPVKANVPHLNPAKVSEPPSVPVRASEPPSVPVRASEPPPLPVRASEPLVDEPPPLPVKTNETPLSPVKANEPPSITMETSEPPPLPVRVDEPNVKDDKSQQLSEKPPPLAGVETNSVDDDEVFEDEGLPPPLPVKKGEVLPPPPPEDSDSDTPLLIEKATDTCLTLEPASSQVEATVGTPMVPSPQDSSAEDEAPPPLPVKKHTKTEEKNDLAQETKLEQLESKPEQPQTFNQVCSDSFMSGPNVTGNSTVRKQPPVPPQRTSSTVTTSPLGPVESDSEGSDSPAPPLPERKVLLPPPPPPLSNSDTDSEDDEMFFSRPSLVAVKSVPINDSSEMNSDTILLSRAKYSMDTSDSSEDDDYRGDAKIISQPSLENDTIEISSSPVTPDNRFDGKEMNLSFEENCDVPSHLPKRIPPPVRQRLGTKVSSPPYLSPQPLSTPPPVRSIAPLAPSAIAKSASSDAIVFLSNDSMTSVYSEIAPEDTKHEDSITSMYSQVGPPPSQHGTQKIESMYSQVGTVPSHVLRGLNGDLGRPISVDLDATDGNVPNRMRSMSELPSKAQKKKKKFEPTRHLEHSVTEVSIRRDISASRQSSVLSPSVSRRGDRNYSQVPKTKEGWLNKRGGKHGDKPWTSRWFTFDGHEMKYFKSPSDKAIECLKSIKLMDMIDVKAIPDVNNDNKKLCRFDLVATNRVFQLASDSQEEVTQWVDVLEAAIKDRSTAGEVEGGSMNNPDKVGFLQKQGHGMIKTWERRYVALKGSRFAYYESKEDFTNGRPINTLEMGLTAVKPDMSGKYRFSITTNRKKEYVFQAISDAEMKEWIEALQKGIMQGLESRTGHNVMPEMNTSSKEIMDRLSKNPSNTTCAECSSTDPVWASVNLGVMLCINCSGVHRSMGTHISKVRSTELDQHIWTDSLIDLIVAIGNKRSNEFWEKHCQQKERLSSDVERDIRENFIRAKYELKAWIPRQPFTPNEVLNKQLCQTVKTSDVMATLELIVQGANVNFVNTSIKGENNTPMLIAQEHEQPLQMELLVQNGAVVPGEGDDRKDEPVNRQGYLYKTGSERTGWRKRFCSLDKTGFKYYKSDNNSEVLGEFPVEEMLSVNVCEDESAKDPHYKYCFEVATAKRPYLFCAERDFEMHQWVAAFQKIIPVNAEDILGFDKIGYIYHKTPGGWKRKWCTLKKKDIWFYKRHEKEVIDLRKAIELRPPDPQGNFEAQCSFQIVALGKTHFLKADNANEADAWYSALRHTQVSGLPLQGQELTNNGIPIIVHKCLQFVESHGIDSEGIYRLSGNKTRVQKLILAFNQDAKGFIIDPETYLVNDVAGALKQFFRSLPDPLLTHHLYASFIDAAQIHDEEEKKTQIQSLVERLPAVNRETLKRLIGHLKKVVDNVAVNKMSAANMVRIFGPTLMTVDTDESTFINATFEFSVIELMFRHYLWMFQIDEIEQRKEEEMQKAMKKLEMAQQMQKQHSVVDSKFLVTVYIKNKEGHAFTSKVSQITSAGELVEEAATAKALTPDSYALYIVLGNSEAERTVHPTERVLTVMQTVQCDFFFCLKQNLFAERVKPYMMESNEAVMVNVREKKRWRKYPCAIKSNHFLIYRDSKLNHEITRTSVHDFDMFFGTMSDVKNPAPTGYQLYLKARVEDQSKYICADSEEDLLRCAGRIAHCKYPDGFPMPIIPRNPLPDQQSPVTKPRTMSEDTWTDPDIYVNVKLTKKGSKTLGRDPVPADLLRELSTKLKKT